MDGIDDPLDFLIFQIGIQGQCQDTLLQRFRNGQ
jgi:hypothetical protein